MIPDNACHFRITAAAGTELAVTSYLEYRHLEYLLDIQGIVLFDRGLQPEGLHPPSGVAGSDFRPLSNFLACCLP